MFKALFNTTIIGHIESVNYLIGCRYGKRCKLQLPFHKILLLD